MRCIDPTIARLRPASCYILLSHKVASGKATFPAFNIACWEESCSLEQEIHPQIMESVCRLFACRVYSLNQYFAYICTTIRPQPQQADVKRYCRRHALQSCISVAQKHILPVSFQLASLHRYYDYPQLIPNVYLDYTGSY